MKVHGLSFAFLLGAAAHANNIQVTNVTLVDNNGTSAKVQFDISWENSWRGGGVANWDAAWVFVKVKQSNGVWVHARLANSGHTAPGGSMIDLGLVSPDSVYNAGSNPVVGVFLRRDADGNGTFTSTAVQLAWPYAAQGIIASNDIAEVKVFAIEMVYVNEGPFYLGTGGSEDNHFKAGNTNNPYLIQSEAAIPISATTGLWATGAIEASTLAGSFPKGFRATYCMKYEMTQQQYVDYLNTLTRSQQDGAVHVDIAPNITYIMNIFVMSSTSVPVSRNYVTSSFPIFANSPVGFYTTRPFVAMDYITWGDLLAYLDWSGLRPMSELEFEKSCRGPLLPATNECAWGNGSITTIGYVFENLDSSNETIASQYSTLLGNCIYQSSSTSIDAPARVGMMAGHPLNSGRMSSGASYYGIMELSGNVKEQVASLRSVGGRAFNGRHGDGAISNNGEHDTAAWPIDMEVRGGGANSPANECQVSMRTTTQISASTYAKSLGGRGVRTAP